MTTQSVCSSCTDQRSPVVQPIAAGQQLLAVPLRLALTDYAGDPDAAAFGLEDAPWAMRLAAKLLRELQQGPASQWAPYLQVIHCKSECRHCRCFG